MKRYIIPCLLWTVLGLGMWIRIDRGDQFPIYQNDDGLFYVWAGNSILDNFFHPTSLTIFETNNQNLLWRSQYRNTIPAEQFGYRLTDPWFDHPFLATILIALPSRLLGYTDFSQIPQMVVRIPAFVASFLSLILTYGLASRLFSRKTGLISLMVLAFWPLAVFSSRQSYIENIMTPFWLGSLWLIWELTHKQEKNKRLLVLLIGCDVFLGWSKFIGYLAFIVSTFWLLKAGLKRQAISVAVAAGISFAIYLGYGTLVGGNYFWATLLNQGGRGAYLTSIFDILRSPDIFGIITDGWWYIGWLSLVWLGRKNNPSGQYLATNIIFWMLALFFLVGVANNSPWYRYPIYPLLAISSAHLIGEWWQTKSLIISGVIMMLGLTGFSVAGLEIPSQYLRLFIAGMMVVMVVGAIKKGAVGNLLNRGLIGVLLLLAIVGNVVAIRKYPYIICKDGNCPEPTKIDVIHPNL